MQIPYFESISFFFIKTWYSLFKVLYNFLKKKEEIDLDFDSEEVSYCFFDNIKAYFDWFCLKRYHLDFDQN